MDGMLSSVTAWESQYKDVSVGEEEPKVAECGEAFMTLMQTISDRYKQLPTVDPQLQFLDLQLELLNDCRIRLLQVRSDAAKAPLGHVFCAILNTVSYITEVLLDWAELVFFVQLKYERSTLEVAQSEKIDMDLSMTRSPLKPVQKTLDDVDQSVFDEIIKLLEKMRTDMLQTIASNIMEDVKSRSKPYRNDKWLALPSQKDLGALGLSSSACEMLFVLKNHLLHMQTELSSPLFQALWKRIAEALNVFIYNEVILANHFNDGGAGQLNFDMTRNLFPLFRQFTAKPENYFKDVKEACILLTMNTGSALLLKEILYDALHNPKSEPTQRLTDPVAALLEHNISKLSMDDVELILSLRTSLSVR